jgi:hypothetical protein
MLSGTVCFGSDDNHLRQQQRTRRQRREKPPEAGSSEFDITLSDFSVEDLNAPPMFSQAGIVHLANRTLSPAANFFIEELLRPGHLPLKRRKVP